MQWKLFFLALASVFAIKAQATSLHCQYQYMGMPIWSITYYLDEQGQFLPEVEVLVSTAPHKESLSVEEPQAGQVLHGWISKEDPKNAIETFIYKERQSQGLTKLINPQMPIAKEVWGDCH